jgi:hypothetical protein
MWRERNFYRDVWKPAQRLRPRHPPPRVPPLLRHPPPRCRHQRRRPGRDCWSSSRDDAGAVYAPCRGGSLQGAIRNRMKVSALRPKASVAEQAPFAMTLRSSGRLCPALADRSFDLLYRLKRWLMLPNSNYYPAVLFEDLGMAAVALDVLSDLWLPIRAIRRGKRAVLRAAMPEASVNEHSDLWAWKDKVGSDAAAQGRFYREVDSIPETRSVSGFANRPLWSSVAAAVRAHDPASRLRDIAPAAGSRRPTLL